MALVRRAMANERLRSAMANARADIDAITKATGVDPKTVQRWLTGRVPHPRHRWAIANLLGEEEGYLWPAARPDLSPGAEATSEVVAAYGHRADIPISKWSDLLATARRQIDLLGYAFLFLPEQFVDLGLSIEKKSAGGCKVRIALADPDGSQVQERDALEQLGGTLPARIQTTLGHLRDVLTIPGVELRFHNVHLYNAIYRFDDEMVVTPYLYRAHGFQHPAFRLRRLGPYGVFASFADQFETIWASATPVGTPMSLANQQEA
jgi:Domain of unknown function (DUF5919)